MIEHHSRDIGPSHAPTPRPPQDRRGGHGWMMIACCIPMLVIAVALVAAGAVSASFAIYALACTAMMVMMRGMHGGHAQHPDSPVGEPHPREHDHNAVR